METMIFFLEELQALIETELENIAKLEVELTQELNKPGRNVRVFGSIVHDFYYCCERIFKRIASEINGSFFEGEKWHKELLYRMTIAIKDLRPAVVSEQLAAELDDYLSFRHVFRNIYGFELKGERLTRLTDKFENVSSRFRDEIRTFLSKLQ